MCEYCNRRALNKPIADVDSDEEDKITIRFLNKPMLNVELDVRDQDGYKACDFFEINYCPMCGRKLGG